MEQSCCGDESRLTANFYEALRCYEMLGMADVETMPASHRLHAQLCHNLLQYLFTQGQILCYN